ncbi:glycosyltransferase involved in cell wall biosynthesis [Mycolicibacterium sp. BK556]|uniref:glycosyltransferase family 4 protein n=1 Tax=unclassified Mycolicibacterium TaxID=2636767 RepID=UPI0016072D02|nr:MULTISPECIES: glycosyltransferase family 1 protein [unclassified Mycolicibacterium]MBB3605033.1 glycosyltransferase involved in cell wall biosynthesis [Mycolicibacterium sp. BK556]MBB3635229.1 glycosyltransferase involved in cell wall biosynthesis [Mycolicibacterium sp. BK607]
MEDGTEVDLLFDVRHINQSGIGTYIVTQLPCLQDVFAEHGLALAVLANQASRPAVDERTRVVLSDPQDAPMYSMQEQKAWANALSATRPRAMWVPHYPFPVSLLAPANRGVRSFVTVHDTLHIMPREINDQPLPKRMYARTMLTLDARRATKIFTPSHATAKTLLAARPSARVLVTPLGLDEIWFEPVDPSLSPVQSPYIVYVGNTKWHKNLTVLLEAFEQVADSIPHKLVIAGGGEVVKTVDSRVDALASRRPDRIVISGRLDFSALRSLVAGADLLVMPSLHEGVGLPPLEAMASHTAVLSSRIPALEETCGDGADYFDPRDPRELAGLLRTYCGDAEARTALAERGFAHVTQRQSRISLPATAEAICAELAKSRGGLR